MSETKKNLKVSWKFVKKRKVRLFLIFILSTILSILSVVIPVLTAKLLLKLTGGFLFELFKVALFILVVELTGNIFNLLLNKTYDNYMVDTITEIQMEMFKETLKIKTKEMDTKTSGTFIDRINNDTNDIVSLFDSLMGYIIDFISNIGVLIAVIFISYPMFFFFLRTSILNAYVGHKRRNALYERQKKYRKIRENKTGLISEIVRGVKDIKLLSATDGVLKKTDHELKRVNKELLQVNKESRKFRFITGNIWDIVDFLFIVLGILLIKVDMLTISGFVILYSYRGRIQNLLDYYNRIADLFKNFNLSASRVLEILTDGFKKEKTDGLDVGTLNGNIEFKNVSFSYGDNNVLNDVNFKINHGEKVGFVGASGAGKSTIFNLITYLYDLKEGEILFDGIDIRKISIESLRKNISLIPQNPDIFNFSIKDNLILSNKDVEEDKMIEACKKAEIYDRILEFDDKFQTKVGEGGVTLSGGERQRLAIARSLIKNSNIILFDEATSALDNITQDKIQKAIYRLDKSKTVLIIAHRLSTVINCDKIVVMDNGKIIDIGTHQELLERCSKYKKLYRYEEINV